jgi:hypothetical protein
MAQRKRRLPISSTGQPAPKFEPDAAFWERCEVAYGHAISGEMREEVVATTNNALWFASMEPDAEAANETAKRIDRYRKAAGALLNELAEPGSSDSIFYAEHLIESELPDITADQFHDLLMSYYGACVRAAQRVADKNEPELRPGGSWDVWIRQLVAIVRGHGLPTTVSHDDEDRPSPFRLLVHELQQGLPVQYRSGTFSCKALESAIGRAISPVHKRPPKVPD